MLWYNVWRFTFFDVDTYALVSFEGDTTAVVPVERVARGTVRDSSNGMVEGDECFVTWSNKKRYAAVFITAGMLVVELLLLIAGYWSTLSCKHCTMLFRFKRYL